MPATTRAASSSSESVVKSTLDVGAAGADSVSEGGLGAGVGAGEGSIDLWRREISDVTKEELDAAKVEFTSAASHNCKFPKMFL